MTNTHYKHHIHSPTNEHNLCIIAESEEGGVHELIFDREVVEEDIFLFHVANFSFGGFHFPVAAVSTAAATFVTTIAVTIITIRAGGVDIDCSIVVGRTRGEDVEEGPLAASRWPHDCEDLARFGISSSVPMLTLFLSPLLLYYIHIRFDIVIKKIV